MKKGLLSLFLFIGGFILCYLAMCYLVPGLRIKLAAEPMVYFIESVKSMALIKSLLSLAVGVLLGCIPLLINKKHN